MSLLPSHPARLATRVQAVLALALVVGCAGLAYGEVSPAGERFHKQVEPLLQNYCYDCHGDGMDKGGVAFDGFKSDQEVLDDKELWFNVLKYLRAGIMPPGKKPKPSDPEKSQIIAWIKGSVFQIDPQQPDSGRVTVRRLNRVEYRNTVRDLVGVDFDVENEFPPDDTGFGFDTIGDVLTISPMLLEKYLTAAQTIANEALPPGKKVEHDSTEFCKRYWNEPMPGTPELQREFAGKILTTFASQAFRRPVDTRTIGRLTELAARTASAPGKTFEDGVREAVVAILASPRFLFREETVETAKAGERCSLVDEYSLASRLSYFLWSSMPDARLFKLAGAHELRQNLHSEVERMLADTRSRAFVRNFTGQWLQIRDVDSIQIDARAVLAREQRADAQRDKLRNRFHELRDREPDLTPAEKEELTQLRTELHKRFANFNLELNGDLRRLMRREVETYFGDVVANDRSVLNLIDSHYTFLNERLAKYYGITNLNVTGDDFRRVDLPVDNPRGGILTMAGVLTVTSNPTRTSPVKRGKFVLDNILGLPPPPPPPSIPPLESAASEFKNHEPTLRQMLELHRAKPLCSSCHNRMDPLGLGLEHFNALGLWRDQDLNQPLDASGELVTGEHFSNVGELKHILAANHRQEFYRCLAGKLLTYAIGRGLEYYDVGTVDDIVDRMEKADGRFSALLSGVIESAPFQKSRNNANIQHVQTKSVRHVEAALSQHP